MNTQIHERLIASLPQGFTIRAATLDDVENTLKLFNRWSQSVIHADELTDPVALRTDWVSPGFDLAEDTLLVFAPNGELVGYTEVWTNNKPPVHPWIWARVDPRYEGLGIGTYLLAWSEERAKKVLNELAPDLRFALQVGTYREANNSKRLFEDAGYRHIRSSYNLQIDMDTPPAIPEWSAGIRWRTFDPDRDLEAVYRAKVEAWRDHFGFVEEPFEEGLQRFKHFTTDYEGFDPTLWFLAMDGSEVAGFCLCRDRTYTSTDVGYINFLGVRRIWRKRGLGLALLRHAFGELYRRGKRKAALDVDAQSLTGALRLYENAGMHVHQAFERFEKEIRPGKEISVQSL